MLSSNNNGNQWNKFGKKILENNIKNYKEKTRSSERLLRVQRSNDEQFQNISSLRKPCDKFQWNVVDENSTVLILTVKLNFNRSICSLSNINVKVAYAHLCQYLLDRCVNNIKCGKHGRCVNSQTDFKCLCSFPYNGTYCDSVSLKNIQLLIAIPIVILAPILLSEPIRNLLWKVIKRLTPSNTNGKNKKINQQFEGVTNGIRQATFFELEPDEKRTRSIFVSIVSLVFFLILIVERILNIKIEEQSFQPEVIISAMITTVIYGLQLLHSIQNYKDRVRTLYGTDFDNSEIVFLCEKREIIPRSVQYPAFILRYLLGGYIICFHSFLFTIVGGKAIVTHISSFKWILISIASIICVYGLHKIINFLINRLFNSYRLQVQTNVVSSSQDQGNVDSTSQIEIGPSFSPPNQITADSDFPRQTTTGPALQDETSVVSPLQRQTSFIGIISSVFRLLTSFYANILFLPRIDYSCFPPPLQTFDSAHKAFECFIRWELLYTYPLILEFSHSAQPVNTTQDGPVTRETTTTESPSDENHINAPQSYERRASATESSLDEPQQANDLPESST
ncbi:unnamed protein product [Rotaria sordida]|uniref:EGF-like domain-containing protein n=1 Tax=Rotaria sordida TaxID=392033 RepID=A0A815AXD1_9BILA|nr:unnamed protein product [Rotaria sordida]